MTAAVNSFPVVAVGAPAGALEAFSQFLRATSNSTGTADMPVLEAADGTTSDAYWRIGHPS